MSTLQDIVNEILKIREAIDQVEVKGNQNRTLLSYAYGRCDVLIQAIQETERQILNENQNGSKETNTLTEDGEVIGEQNSESAG